MTTLRFSDSITGGGIIENLEQKFSGYMGTRFTVAMSNCTSAIHAGLLASGINKGDEVIAPAYTFGGTIAGLLNIHAIPVFADIDDTLTLDIEDVKSKITSKTKAIIAVHIFGHPCDMDSLVSICQQYDLALIEDCAQALGAKVHGKYVGSFAIGCFSFGFNKPMSAGEGGMITMDSADIYDRVLFYTQHPLRQKRQMFGFCESNEFALNYRIHPLTAKAILEYFDNGLLALSKKKSFFNSIHQAILRNPLKGLVPVTVRDGVEHSWYRYSPKLCPSLRGLAYEDIKEFFAKYGCDIADGQIQMPLSRHSALGCYLSKQITRKIRKTSIPHTEDACKTRVIIIRKDHSDR